MCGICGVVGRHVEEHRLHAATDLMQHRGPDEAGYLQEAGVAFGMRRLSIIDVAGGSQPKTNESGTIQIIFNGEIYNYRELQRELAALGHTFRSNSDTEVIVHAYEEWRTGCFARLHGIFALALWCRSERKLVLARDQLGVKPLYYSIASRERGLTFASELSPLLALLPARPAIDSSSLALYLQYGYVPAPHSIYEGIYKLPPGHWLTRGAEEAAPTIRPFWSPLEVASQSKSTMSRAEAEDLVDDALAAAVKRQLVSEVPLGAFLSGGTDSSAVVAMMQRASNQTARTFSIGFVEQEADESRYASQVAHYLGTQHHSWTLTEKDAIALIPKLPRYFDEPFADSSAIPTYLVSQLARQHVTVALSGDGGDELFGGYHRYQRMYRARHWWDLPASLRTMAVTAIGRLPGPISTSARRADQVLRAQSLDEAYRRMMCITPDPIVRRLVSQSVGASHSGGAWPSVLFSTHSLREAMMLTDLVTYLPDDILTKVDRASMAHSLEARVPLLDVPFVETVISLPLAVRLDGGPKSLLKRVLGRYVPAAFVNRPKHGFSIPLHRWLRTELREQLTDYLTAGAIASHGLWSVEPVELMIREHLQGERNRGHALWALLMFQIWYEHWYRTGRASGSRQLEPAI